jgi:hypothetical protein
MKACVRRGQDIHTPSRPTTRDVRSGSLSLSLAHTNAQTHHKPQTSHTPTVMGAAANVISLLAPSTRRIGAAAKPSLTLPVFVSRKAAEDEPAPSFALSLLTSWVPSFSILAGPSRAGTTGTPIGAGNEAPGTETEGLWVGIGVGVAVGVAVWALVVAPDRVGTRMLPRGFELTRAQVYQR